MSEYEIEIALDEIYNEERRLSDFIQWCELMEREHCGHESPEF